MQDCSGVMESAPEQAGSTDEVDGGLISKFTAGMPKLFTL